MRKNFGEVVTLLVVELTMDKLRCEAIGKVKYLSDNFSCERIASSWALVIKLADRLDNISDLKDRDVEFARRIKSQTLDFLNALEEKRTLTLTHKKLIAAIREKLSEVLV